MRPLRPPPAWAGLLLLAVLVLPPVREGLEGSMTRHMLLQFPLVALAGGLLAGALPRRAHDAVQRWNAFGITGLVASALVLMLLMIPRLLDLALIDAGIAVGKWLALLACGAALRLSWARAGGVVQAFFLGNVLPMMAVAGQVYQEAPLRLCNAYLLDDQVGLGQALVALAMATAAGWIAWAFLTLARREARSLPADAPHGG
jgi:hypothetical protein